MIVFGTRGKVVAGTQKQGIACSSCGKQPQNTFGVLRYFHIFWIPVFPTKKEDGLECPHCKQTLIGKDVPDRLRQDIKESIFTKGKVLPMFTGLFLLAILFGFAGYTGMEQSKKEAAFLANPAVNDYYIVRLTKLFEGQDTKHPYGILRVKSISGGSVELIVGNYAYSSTSGARKAISKGETGKAGYFGAEPISLNAVNLPGLKGDGVIKSVKRH